MAETANNENNLSTGDDAAGDTSNDELPSDIQQVINNKSNCHMRARLCVAKYYFIYFYHLFLKYL